MEIMDIIHVDQNTIDRLSFRWIYQRSEAETVYPPMIWKNGGETYQLNYFDKLSDETIGVQGSFTDAINASVEFYGADTLSIIELSNLLWLSDQFATDPASFDFFEQNSIQGRKHFDILRRLQECPEILKTYVAEKNVSLKILGIYLKLSDNLKQVVQEYVMLENPSVSSFRKFVHLVFDNSRVINTSTYDAEYFSTFSTPSFQLKTELKSELNELLSAFDQIHISNDNEFETADLKFQFNIDSPDSFRKMLAELQQNEKTIHQIYDLLKRYDLY